MAFRNAGSALAALLAPWAIAACGSSRFAGSTSAPEGGSESPLPSDASAATLPSATAFADVYIEADFTQPVDLPPPATAITGDSASLVGTWVQLETDGSVCTVGPKSYHSCLYLDIQEDDAGVVQGIIHEDAPNADSGTPGTVVGPFPPATNPNVGYPPTVAPSDYETVYQLVPNVGYHVLDGTVTNGSFTFWFSTLDLWSTWCALQTPYAWAVRGATKYRCVPQTATSANTDVGKFDLCISVEDGPQCTNSAGFVYPCACDGGSGPVECGIGVTVCECSATQCRANLRSKQIGATLTLDGGKLIGGIQYADYMSAASFAFQRATQ